MTTPFSSLTLIAALLVTSVAAAMQVPNDPTLKRVDAPIRPLEPIDATVEDRNSLATSLRVSETGLREPANFSSVYRFTDNAGREMFLRADNGLYAVFPRSVYKATRQGLVPEVPAGTEFFIGPPPSALPRVDPRSIREMIDLIRPLETTTSRIEARVSGLVLAGASSDEVGTSSRRNPVARAGPGSSVAPTIATDHGYRLTRLRRLLRQASSDFDRAQAARGSSSSPSK